MPFVEKQKAKQAAFSIAEHIVSVFPRTSTQGSTTIFSQSPLSSLSLSRRWKSVFSTQGTTILTKQEIQW